MDKPVVLVTGASSGIGEATARLLADQRYSVVLTARRKEKLVALAKDLRTDGRRVVDIPGDPADPEDVKRIVHETLRTFGVIDAMVLNAGWGNFWPIQDTTTANWESIQRVNLSSAFFFSRQAVAHMKERGGTLVFVSSVAGTHGYSEASAYCASKWGLMGFAAALREECWEKKIRVCTVCPGAVDTSFWEKIPGKWPREKMLQSSDVADAIHFMLEQPPRSMIQDMVITPSCGPISPEE